MSQPDQVVSKAYPFLRISVEIRGWQQETLALLDTGFEGALAVPTFVPSLGLGMPDTSTNWELADGSVVEAPVFAGTVQVLGMTTVYDADVTVLVETYLLGRGILDLCEVTFDHGERVIVKPRPGGRTSEGLECYLSS